MKKLNKNKKGFTIVELVIVIAVIAILAAVLIPTFTTVVEKANQSKALQEARNAYTAILVADEDANINDKSAEGVDAWIKTSGDYYVSITDGVLGTPTKTEPTLTNFEEQSDIADIPSGVKVYFAKAK